MNPAAAPPRPARSDPEFIRLDQFLKVQQLAASGGEAKWIIKGGAVKVNGRIERRRGRKLFHGDEVAYRGQALRVVFQD